MMRGKSARIFTESVTHLITTEVGSAKYHVRLIGLSLRLYSINQTHFDNEKCFNQADLKKKYHICF